MERRRTLPTSRSTTRENTEQEELEDEEEQEQEEQEQEEEEQEAEEQDDDKEKEQEAEEQDDDKEKEEEQEAEEQEEEEEEFQGLGPFILPASSYWSRGWSDLVSRAVKRPPLPQRPESSGRKHLVSIRMLMNTKQFNNKHQLQID